ncbi:hypothetical protein ACFL3H_07985, partial [Gemmatimonadota bacterium]
MSLRVGVDAREWVPGRFTGIGRFLEAVIRRALEVRPDWQWILYGNSDPVERLPSDQVVYRILTGGITPYVDQVVLPRAIGRDAPDIFFSPYPKTP